MPQVFEQSLFLFPLGAVYGEELAQCVAKPTLDWKKYLAQTVVINRKMQKSFIYH